MIFCHYWRLLSEDVCFRYDMHIFNHFDRWELSTPVNLVCMLHKPSETQYRPNIGSAFWRLYSREDKTSHLWQIFIFSFQFFWTAPSQIVPLINQQSLPAWNSKAGHFFLRSGGHFFIIQHVFRSVWLPLILESKKKSCRSTWAGTDRHPCS